jgi:hypothetical protein
MAKPALAPGGSRPTNDSPTAASTPAKVRPPPYLLGEPQIKVAAARDRYLSPANYRMADRRGPPIGPISRFPPDRPPGNRACKASTVSSCCAASVTGQETAGIASVPEQPLTCVGGDCCRGLSRADTGRELEPFQQKRAHGGQEAGAGHEQGRDLGAQDQPDDRLEHADGNGQGEDSAASDAGVHTAEVLRGAPPPSTSSTCQHSPGPMRPWSAAATGLLPHHG